MNSTALIKDLEIVRKRLYDQLFYLVGENYLLFGKLSDLDTYESLTIDGCCDGSMRFKDIDYTDKNQSGWAVTECIRRVLCCAVKREKADESEKARLERLIKGHLKDYAFGGYVNPNWWHNEIGAPQILGQILFLARDLLEGETYESLLRKLEMGSILMRPEILTEKTGYHTGGNLTSYCRISLYHACIVNSPEEILSIVNGLAEETAGAREGLQPDGSFFQHGRRLYSFGYGALFLSESADMFCLMSGTAFEFPLYAMENVMKHLLDGIRYMIGGAAKDISPLGRGYTRIDAQLLWDVIPPLKKLISCKSIPRKDEAIDLLARLEAGKQPIKAVKYFENARILTLHTDNLYVSFKGTDPTLGNAEICTNENYLGHNFSYGTNTVAMRTGKEYLNIAPLWNYSYIPGTTSRDETDEELMAYPDFTHYSVTTDDFGGAQISDIGVAFIGAENYGVRATKCAIATPDYMVLLGAGIKDSENKPLHTTVDQSFANGDITLSDNGMAITHSGIYYKNLDAKSPFKVKVEHRSFGFRRNHWDHRPYPVSGDIFTAYIDHTSENASHAYLITECELKDKASGVSVLVNNEDCQAVKLSDGRIVAVFHKACKVTVADLSLEGEKNEIKVID